ncbi:MAG: hypothetical protein M1833_002858 [Piccolia ochrophora]|nr:MAG: hypothetical protein M1833_002858 [Piccolia ochrophora]
MRSQVAQRLRKSSLSSAPPPLNSPDYSTSIDELSNRVLYRSPLPSQDGYPIFILHGAAFPDPKEVDYDTLLPYVLAKLPPDDELIGGQEYEVIFFAGPGGDGPTAVKKGRPGWGWFVQAYNILSRAMRKRLRKLYIVHERSWVRVLVEMFSTIVSPKSRRKIFHESSLSGLAFQIPIEQLLIPPSVYLHDRRISPTIDVPYGHARKAFGAKHPIPVSTPGAWRLPRVLRETSTFVLLEGNIETEGLFRIPAHMRLTDIVREAYDRGQHFIAWKECDAVLFQDEHEGDGFTNAVHKIPQEDCYGVHLAASLIKLWYSKLQEPLVAPSTYRTLTDLFTHDNEPVSLDRLTDLISPDSKWSNLTLTSRLLLTNHLLPLLSRVTEQRDKNKMTAANLAVCFTPGLLRGPDPMEDTKMIAVVRRILEAAIQYWQKGLRQACGIDPNAFDKALRPPVRDDEYEDPMEDQRPKRAQTAPGFEGLDHQYEGITLEDNETVLVQRVARPSLPPRPAADDDTDRSNVETGIKRKPAPPAAVPPRYSVVFGSDGNRHYVPQEEASASTSDGFVNYDPSQHSIAQNPSTDQKGDILGDTLPTHAKSSTQQKNTNDVGNNLIDQDDAEAVKRKPLGPTASTTLPSRAGMVALPGLTEEPDLAGDSTHPLNPPQFGRNPFHRPRLSDPPLIPLPQADSFAKPTGPASARTVSNPVPIKPRTIQNLAKPIQPSAINLFPPPPLSAAPPVPSTAFPKTRTPSPVLAQRFQPNLPQRANSDLGPRTPKRLQLGDESVEGLRRLYEERAGTAKSLVGASSGGGGT